MKIPKIGTKVITHKKLGTTAGMTIAQKHLDARVANLSGTFKCIVGGHGGDVWFIEHEDGSVGAYCYDELDVEEVKDSNETWLIDVEPPINEDCDERDYVVLSTFDYTCNHIDHPDYCVCDINDDYPECSKEKCPIRKEVK